MPVSKRLLTFFLLSMKCHEQASSASLQCTNRFIRPWTFLGQTHCIWIFEADGYYQSQHVHHRACRSRTDVGNEISDPSYRLFIGWGALICSLESVITLSNVFGSQDHWNRIIYSSINLASFLPVIKTPNADQFHDLDASDSSQFQNSKFQESLTVKRWWYSFCHTIAEISIAGNIHRLFRNEPRTTQGILLNWIQMHKQGMFTNLQYP